MGSASSWLPNLGLAWLVARAILSSLLGILLLVGFIVFRRWYRGRHFNRLSRRTVALREQWPEILAGKIPGSAWRLNVLDCQIVEDILLDNIEVSDKNQLPTFLACLRNSGLLDLRIRQARSSEGWQKRLALLALGRTRAPEAVPALVEALESPSEETRVAAVRGLGRISSPQAAFPLLDLFAAEQLHVPEHTLKNALLNCCRETPEVLVPYLDHASGRTRELIARVLGELANPSLGEELLILAADPLPEVRASAARALAKVQPEISFPVLSTLAADAEWFVRLRAVIAMSSLDHSGKIYVLLRALCDLNRHVRQRAAWTLARTHQGKEEILEKVAATQDNYALQAFLSELERCGSLDAALDGLGNIADRALGAADLENVAALVRDHFAAPAKVTAAVAGKR
ncbi:MAG: HEAT repeat domain-containing protein [Acidobacteriia bacterium]|nr:HEAT repeat domain-containing protein [Terriglobia bacterium]